MSEGNRLKKTIRAGLWIGLLATSVFADVPIYRPDHDVLNPASLGNGSGDANVIYPLANILWACHFGFNGQFNNAGSEQKEGFVQGHVALINNNVPTNPLRNNPPALLWTEAFSVTDSAVQDLKEIMFLLNNHHNLIRPQVALRVGGNWVVSVQTFEHAGGQTVRTILSKADLNGMMWHELEFTPGTVLRLDTTTSKAFSQLEGNVDAVGFYYGAGALGTARARIRELTVTSTKKLLLFMVR